MSGDNMVVPKRWVEEVVIALVSATAIGMRSCRPGDGLNYANHDRLVDEARILLAGSVPLDPGPSA